MIISIASPVMTLTQLEHIIALDKYRHFGQAASACNITQSTLSISIQKLEQELEAEIFNRGTHPISVTEIGKEIIIQAKVVVVNAQILSEISLSKKNSASGKIMLGLIGSVSVYLLPKIHKFIRDNYPNVRIVAEEGSSQALCNKLALAEIDCGIMAGNMAVPQLLEIPLYKEELMVFVSEEEKDLHSKEVIHISDLHKDKLWRLHGSNSPGNRLFPIDNDENINMVGTVETLVRVVEMNGGYTIIPDTHKPLMRQEFRNHIRALSPKSHREISLYIRKDFVSERLLNILVEAVKYAVPEKCSSNTLLNYPIKL